MTALHVAADIINGALVLMVLVFGCYLAHAILGELRTAISDWREHRLQPPWLYRLDLAGARKRRRRRAPR